MIRQGTNDELKILKLRNRTNPTYSKSWNLECSRNKQRIYSIMRGTIPIRTRRRRNLGISRLWIALCWLLLSVILCWLCFCIFALSVLLRRHAPSCLRCLCFCVVYVSHRHTWSFRCFLTFTSAFTRASFFLSFAWAMFLFYANLVDARRPHYGLHYIWVHEGASPCADDTDKFFLDVLHRYLCYRKRS